MPNCRTAFCENSYTSEFPMLEIAAKCVVFAEGNPSVDSISSSSIHSTPSDLASSRPTTEAESNTRLELTPPPANLLNRIQQTSVFKFIRNSAKKLGLSVSDSLTQSSILPSQLAALQKELEYEDSEETGPPPGLPPPGLHRDLEDDYSTALEDEYEPPPPRVRLSSHSARHSPIRSLNQSDLHFGSFTPPELEMMRSRESGSDDEYESQRNMQVKGQQEAGGMEQCQQSNSQQPASPAISIEPDPPPAPEPPELDLRVTNDRTEHAREALTADRETHALHSFPPFAILPLHQANPDLILLRVRARSNSFNNFVNCSAQENYMASSTENNSKLHLLHMHD